MASCFLPVVHSFSLPSVAAKKAEVAPGQAPKLIAKTTYEVKYVPDASGKIVEQRKPVKKLFQLVNKKVTVPDPSDPTLNIVVEVPTEVAYTPNKKTGAKMQKLKARYLALKKREAELKSQYSQQKSKLNDLQVLEDGAPAPPDAQEVKMAQELYDELDATQIPKAKNIQEHVIRDAREFAKGAGAGRQAIWDFFTDMSKKPLVPSHGWGMTM
jgi:hypothetical protein